MRDVQVIEAKGVTKKYFMGEECVLALDGADIEVAEGEMVAITGPSGSGKSTLMHILGCLDRPDSGTYRLAGEDVSKMSKRRLAEVRNRRIGFIFQTFNLLPRLNAVDNVALPLVYAGARDASKRAMEALARVGLESRSHHKPNQLSGGQRQRAAIARALINNPALLLADEPTGNLDSRTSAEILDLFKELNAQGRTFVVVTHDPSVAAHCSREIRLIDGKVIGQSGKEATKC